MNKLTDDEIMRAAWIMTDSVPHFVALLRQCMTTEDNCVLGKITERLLNVRYSLISVYADHLTSLRYDIRSIAYVRRILNNNNLDANVAKQGGTIENANRD